MTTPPGRPVTTGKGRTAGHPPAAWGKSTTIRVPVTIADKIKAIVREFKQSFKDAI